MNEADNFALVRKPANAVDKAAPGTKRILAGIVADTLAVARRKSSELTIFFQRGLELQKRGEHDQAFVCFKQAAEKGHLNAQYQLGKCYLRGDGVTENESQGIAWLEIALNQGHGIAGFALGNYFGILSQHPNYQKAIQYHQKAIDLGYERGTSNLANIREHLRKADEISAIQKSAEQGDAGAQCRLGYCYEWGNDVEQDFVKAVNWYRKAAEQGYAEAQFRLGRCFKIGWGVDRDATEAVKWFCTAAEQGHVKSQRHLGGCFENADGATHNYVEAVKWYRKAAEQGDADAQELLGLCYINGDGLIKDETKAYYWFRLADRQADEAFEKLDEATKEAYKSANAPKLSLLSPKQIQEISHHFRLSHRLTILKSDG